MDEEQVAALETQLAQAKAEADAAAINAEHLSQVMEQRYAALAGEHSQVREQRRVSQRKNRH